MVFVSNVVFPAPTVAKITSILLGILPVFPEKICFQLPDPNVFSAMKMGMRTRFATCRLMLVFTDIVLGRPVRLRLRVCLDLGP
jgi:hypothetical protein